MPLNPLKIVLASQSPRRRELLSVAGIEHVVRTAAIDEAPLPGEPPIDYVRRVVRDKAFVVPRLANEIILAADTTVVCDAQILGKPVDAADAARMLRLLAGRVSGSASGKAHDVITGICLLHGDSVIIDHASTRVWFHPMSDDEIEQYVRSGEPADKAGAYAIQGIASRYVERIEGSYSNVVGLPVALVWRALESIRNSPS